jgi:hypothetical protein
VRAAAARSGAAAASVRLHVLRQQRLRRLLFRAQMACQMRPVGIMMLNG